MLAVMGTPLRHLDITGKVYSERCASEATAKKTTYSICLADSIKLDKEVRAEWRNVVDTSKPVGQWLGQLKNKFDALDTTNLVFVVRWTVTPTDRAKSKVPRAMHHILEASMKIATPPRTYRGPRPLTVKNISLERRSKTKGAVWRLRVGRWGEAVRSSL